MVLLGQIINITRGSNVPEILLLYQTATSSGGKQLFLDIVGQLFNIYAL